MPKRTAGYRIGARHYLERSGKQLRSGTPAALFYAAFELRCGIEARMQQYLEDQQQIAGKLREGWSIPDLREGHGKAFGPGGELIVAITVETGTEEEPVSLNTFYYTPVGRDLQNGAERLGEHLLVMKELRPPRDSWWNDTRAFIEATHKSLEQACPGTLVGPPLLSERGQIEMRIEILEAPEYAEELVANYIPGRQTKL